MVLGMRSRLTIWHSTNAWCCIAISIAPLIPLVHEQHSPPCCNYYIMNIAFYTGVYTCIHACTCTYVCMYVSIYVCMYMYICTYAFVWKLCRSFSSVGHQPARVVQEVQLLSAYTTITPILHELFHVLGRYHEHMRHDRDYYVQLHPENIYTGEKTIHST